MNKYKVKNMVIAYFAVLMGLILKIACILNIYMYEQLLEKIWIYFYINKQVANHGKFFNLLQLISPYSEGGEFDALWSPNRWGIWQYQLPQ